MRQFYCVMTIVAVVALAAFGGQAFATPIPTCDVLWTFDGTLNDATANGNNGTLNTGTATYTGANTGPLNIGQGISIASGQGVDKASAVNLPTAATAAWTINAWMKLSSTTVAFNTLGGFGPRTSLVAGDSRGVISHGPATNFYLFGSTADLNSGYAFPGDNAWHMYTVTYDGANMTMYVDGVQKATAAKTLAATSAAIYVGNPSAWGVNTTFTPKVANFSVWSGAATQDQVTYLDGNPQASVIPEPGTLALLAMGLIGLLCYAWRKRK